MRWRIEPSGPDTYAVHADHGPASRRAFFEALATDSSLGRSLTAALRGSRHVAFAWEMPLFSDATAEMDAVFAVIDSPGLVGVAPDPSPFAMQFASDEPIVTFANLGDDAVLVVPSPDAIPEAAHLAAFVRTAAAEVVDRLWHVVGRAVAERRAARPGPVWVSTAGLGVHWLHVRLDDRPKYYRHRPFTIATS